MKPSLSGNAIKLIAIIAMTVDHIAWVLFPGYSCLPLALVLHGIGRITCPIMCYFIAEGYHHTKHINRYTARLFVFSFLSHFAYVFFSEGFVDWRSFLPFCYGESLDQTSVMWSLAWGLVMLRVAHSPKIKDPVKYVLILGICLVTLPADWSCIASLCILAFGTNRGRFSQQMLWMTFYVGLYSLVYFFSLDKVYGLLQMAVVLAIPVLATYNGARGGSLKGRGLMKYAFYLYYPLHLALLGWLRLLL